MIPDNHLLCLCDFETTGIDPATDLPIEVGCLFLNSQLDLVGSYSTLIVWDTPEFHAGIEVNVWPEKYASGFQYHSITMKDLGDHGLLPGVVARDIYGAVRDHLHHASGEPSEKRCVLLSDNIQFEWQFMKMLFKHGTTDWPFHYCGWDTSLLLEMSGVGDPPAMRHRALEDCRIILESIHRAKRVIEKGRAE